MRLSNSTLQRSVNVISNLVVSLAAFALGAELLPEFEAKLIVVPALISAIALGIIQVVREKNRLSWTKEDCVALLSSQFATEFPYRMDLLHVE